MRLVRESPAFAAVQDKAVMSAARPRDKAAARRYFEKSIDQNGLPKPVIIDGSSANLAAFEAINAELETPIKVRQVHYRDTCT